MTSSGEDKNTIVSDYGSIISQRIDTNNSEFTSALSKLKDDDELYQLDEDIGIIRYFNKEAQSGEIKSFFVNKYGYVTKYLVATNDGSVGFELSVIGEPKKTLSKDEFISESTGLYQMFNDATSVYTREQISNVVISGNNIEVEDIPYYEDENGRILLVKYRDEGGNPQYAPIVKSSYYGEALRSHLAEDEDATYLQYADGSLEYYYGEMENYYKHIKYNKYGYLENLVDDDNGGSKTLISCTYDGEPQEIVKPVTEPISIECGQLFNIASKNGITIQSVTEKVTIEDSTITIKYTNNTGNDVIIPINICSQNEARVLLYGIEFKFASGETEFKIDLGAAVAQVQLGDTLEFLEPAVTPDPDPEKIISIDSESITNCCYAYGITCTSVSETVTDTNTIMSIQHQMLHSDIEIMLDVIKSTEDGGIATGVTIHAVLYEGTTETNIDLRDAISVVESGSVLSFTIAPVTPGEGKH